MATKSEINAKHPDWWLVSNAPLDRVINCASCGRPIEFGHCFTSFEQSTDDGMFGLAVCGTCYKDELPRHEPNGSHIGDVY